MAVITTPTRTWTLKDGRACVLRVIRPDEAQAFVAFLQQLFAESNHFFSREQADMTVAQAGDFLETENRRGRMLGAYVDGRLIANLDIVRYQQPRRHHVATLSMGVLNEFQRQGIGRVMVEEAISWAKSRGTIDKISLYLRSHNEAAWHLYQQLGFQEEGRRINEWRVDGRYVDEILMYKWLKDDERP